jgi:murein DD-endopeptidase MepM/ murein hydrolase activator NlpD
MTGRHGPARASALLFAVLAAVASLAEARDPTIGLCTRADDLEKALAVLDPRIQELTGAEGDEAKAELGEKIAEEHGTGLNIECLIRYREPDMKHVFLPLLKDPQWPVRARALFGLKMTGGEGEVEAVSACLADADARIREMAANALGHLAPSVPEALRTALGVETDRFAKASLHAAVALIESEEKPYKPWAEVLTGPEGAKRVERAWAMKGKTAFNKYDAVTLEYPKAGTFDWPVSWYEGSLFCEVPRKSFGAKGTHTGEDMAWFREGASVFSVADGLVRMVQGPGGDWGFLVAVEHRLSPHVYVTAVYGHLGFDLLVKPGDVVKKGQRIGTVGMSCAVENGGYGAHLHFGLSQGPFRRCTNMRRGSKINLKFPDKTVAAPVLLLTYLPQKKDPHGFPGLGMVVRFPDGTNKLLPGPMGKLPQQVAWLKGYVKGCVGWYDPRKFIEAKSAEEEESPAEPEPDEGGEPGE